MGLFNTFSAKPTHKVEDQAPAVELSDKSLDQAVGGANFFSNLPPALQHQMQSPQRLTWATVTLPSGPRTHTVHGW
ncbi:hypothetical protein [Methylobacterium nonmethylotrophicum]|uniref:Uncharacterized protein n=1 Tax=Methylobacterium nonmethylotrophicum TaxID=1141884 RepID=A0A4Z0NHV1_9HYPH|nr:hypothetical protein [Methylobacterium nonmethylotrophicum]TGD95358.1 hypothetical protein EU555_28490 [Methylobacterium nonmethylotrophicum]